MALAEPAGAGDEFFERKIRPILVKHCYECHSPQAKKVQGGLLLHSRAAARKGGETSPAIVPGDVEASLLIRAIRYDGLEMPPSGKLPADVVADFERWIEAGAPDPREDTPGVATNHQVDLARAREFWAYQRPQRHKLPAVQDKEWPRQAIDWFVLEQLEAAGLGPSPEADRRTFIRRVTFDLIGLPPTPQEVEAFLSDASQHAYENVVERLLKSPHYGERWARMWLDVARYAEDQAHIVGNNQSLVYPNAYLYRDWVIAALNDDLPFDEFVKLQLAADLIDPDDKASHAALGFIGLGPKYYRRGDLSVMADEWEDRVDTVARGLLGLTVACARCHDHKFDPISTEDYHALAGVFASTEMFNRPLDGKPAEGNGQAKDPKDALHIVRDSQLRDLTVFIRGDVNSKGPVVKRRFLSALTEGEPETFRRGSGRQELAEAIVDRNNPLVARVIVNRIWALNFGRPLVGTPSNFGQLGQRPTHPELLDDLAVRFMETGWSLKWLQREIVLSATYRQISRAGDSQLASDPENHLLGRMNRRRLSVEAWRDAILSASGRLNRDVGGKSIDPRNPDETRRSIYSSVSRLELNPMLALFDFPDPNAHAERRAETTTPLQKLFVLNSPFMVKQAEALSARLLAEVETAVEAADELRVQRAYELLFSRPPTQTESDLALTFLRQSEGDPQTAWQQYAQVLLASNEMLFVD